MYAGYGAPLHRGKDMEITGFNKRIHRICVESTIKVVIATECGLGVPEIKMMGLEV